VRVASAIHSFPRLSQGFVSAIILSCQHGKDICPKTKKAADAA
jgi:hypothetical protein